LRSASEIVLQGKGYDSFINAIKSPKTKIAYAQSLRRYLNHRKMTEVDNLLLEQNPRLIESQIVDYVMTLRSEGIAYTTIQFLIAPVLTFYSLNDVVLNKRKISRYFGEYRKRVKDRAYTSDEIWKVLQTADQSIPMSNQKTMVEKAQTQREGITDTALENLTAIEDEIETSSPYFEPKPDKEYMLSINPEVKIEPRLNERFKIADGKPTVRYDIKITHVNNGKQQLWETYHIHLSTITQYYRRQKYLMLRVG
jgi:hypothetical protein